MRLRVLMVGTVVLVLIGGSIAGRAGGRKTPRRQAPAAASQGHAHVTAAVVRRAELLTRVPASGSVTSIRDAKIGSKISGRVAAVLVEEGARVSAGAPLLRVDTSDLAAQQAQTQANVAAARAQLLKVLTGARPQERRQSADAVNQARAGLNAALASLQLAEANAERDRSLKSEGAISQRDLDAAETQVSVARAQVEQARAAYDSSVQNAALVHIGSRDEDIQQARTQLAQAEAQLAAAQVQLRDATIYAPFAGTITQRSVEPGETVSSANASSAHPLFVLSQVDDVYVELVVPARHRGELRPGQDAVMTIDGLVGLTVRGRVETIRPAADAPSRTFTVKVRVPNPSDVLRPGMFARGAVIVGARHGVLLVPEQGVVTAASGSFVWVVQDGRAVRRPVSLGDHRDGQVEVISGLADGETVVVRGQDGLADRQAVIPRGL